MTTPQRFPAEEIDRPCYALITDLKRRGLLDDTLVIWGGEFGRTVYSEMPLPASRKKVLDERLAAYRSGKSKPVSHEELMRRLRSA